MPFAGRHKIELKKMCGGENKKYRRVGNECRLTRCPFLISFLCSWSLVKMVCSYVNVQFLVVCLIVALSSFRLTGNDHGFAFEAVFINVKPITEVKLKIKCSNLKTKAQKRSV